jgi:NDP-sugar pyrophosphorylase family protein
MRNFVVPYGVCEVKNSGELECMREKPEYDFLVNTGLYLLDPQVLDLIPEDSYFDMTDLINEVKESNKRVGVFPVSEKSWADIGQWTEYQDTIKNFSV